MLCNSFPVSWFQDRFTTSKLAKRPGKKISKMNDGVNNFFIRYALKEKKTILFGNFSQQRGGVFPNPKTFFCKFTKYFFVCQIHSEVQKHVLQMGG